LVTGYFNNAAALFGGYDPTKVRFAPSSVLLPDANRQNWLWDVFGENRFVTMVAEGVCEHGLEPAIRRAFGRPAANFTPPNGYFCAAADPAVRGKGGGPDATRATLQYAVDFLEGHRGRQRFAVVGVPGALATVLEGNDGGSRSSSEPRSNGKTGGGGGGGGDNTAASTERERLRKADTALSTFLSTIMGAENPLLSTKSAVVIVSDHGTPDPLLPASAASWAHASQPLLWMLFPNAERVPHFALTLPHFTLLFARYCSWVPADGSGSALMLLIVGLFKQDGMFSSIPPHFPLWSEKGGGARELTNTGWCFFWL
jgi:hypothetical protein